VSGGDRRTLGEVLRDAAEAHPDRDFLTFTENGRTLTYGEFNGHVNRIANGFAARGVSKGDPVNIMLPNGIDYLAVSYALKKLGAMQVGINREFRGPALARMLNLAQAKVLVTSRDCDDALADVRGDVETTATVVVVDEEVADHPLPAETVALDDVLAGEEEPGVAVDGQDPAVVIFTSGTTGVSKGCVIGHRVLVRGAEVISEAISLTSADSTYTPYPLFHARAAYCDVLSALITGGRVVLAPRFSASRFWKHQHDFDVTVFSIIGTVMQILWKGEPSPLDRGHRVRVTWGGPLPVDAAAFEERFGVRVLPQDGVYGMSETGMICMSSFDPALSGKVRSIYQVRIADDNDDEVPAGEVGEILVRPTEPGTSFSGYLAMPQATVDATRNLWFHTGDLGHVDSENRLTFLGRKREMIRRAGHNISTWEIEEVVGDHPDVIECAAIGVPSELGEQDVKLYVSTRPGSALDADALVEFCRGRMASFMIPQHVEFLVEIPKTPTDKPAKSELLALHMASLQRDAAPAAPA
jgi:crotonobetaine/carnitine-CoA ligase